MGKTKSKSSGKGFLSGLLAVVAIALGIVAIVFMTSPILTSETDNSLFTATLTIPGFALAFGGETTIDVLMKIGNISSSSNGTIDMHVGALMMFIVLLVGIVLSLTSLLLKIFKVKGGVFKALAFVAFLCFLAAGIMFFCAQPICGDIAKYEYNGASIDFSDSLKLGYGAILSGILSIVAGVSAAASAIVAK